MADSIELFRRRILRMARQATPEFGREILRAWEMLSTVNQAELARRIAMGGAPAVIEMVLADAALEVAFSAMRETMFRSVSDAGAMFIGGMTTGATAGTVAFNTLNPNVIAAIEAIDLSMMESLRSEAGEVIRAFVENGLRDGVNPRTMARGLKDVTGLAPQHERWIANFRSELEANDPRALARSLRRGHVKGPFGRVVTAPGHAGGVGVGKRDLAMMRRTLGIKGEKLTGAQINRIVDAYTRRLTAFHAETIARTAALDAMKTAQDLATQQAIDQGFLDADRMVSEWSAVMDDRVRPEHEALHGEVVPFGSSFSNGDRIPGLGAYNCRCLRIDRQVPRSKVRADYLKGGQGSEPGWQSRNAGAGT